MKAVKFYGIGDVRTVDVPAVVPDGDQALIQALYGGICGSDLHIYRKGMFVRGTGETMGHEFVGRVLSAPAGCALEAGNLVVGDPRVPCGHCQACLEGETQRCAQLGFIGEVRPGCFAQLLALEPEKLIPLSPGTDLRQAALCEPLAVAVHACKGIVKNNPRRVLVVGAGPIGLLIACLLKKLHRTEWVCVAERDGFRRSFAASAGADQAAAELSEAGRGFDCAVDAVGAPGVLDGMLSAVRPGGSIFVSAIYESLPEFDINTLVSNEQQLLGNNAYSFADLKEAARLVETRAVELDWLITRVLPAGQAAEAFRLLTAKEKSDLKILLDFRAPDITT